MATNSSTSFAWRRRAARPYCSRRVFRKLRVCDRVAILRRGELVHLQEMSELREGRHVTAKFTGRVPNSGPGGETLPSDAVADGHLNLTYRGPLPTLLDWLAKQPLADLKVEPQGLSAIYRRFHG